MLDPFLGSGTTCTVARAWNRITDIGMLRKGESNGQSSAIFPKRGSS